MPRQRCRGPCYCNEMEMLLWWRPPPALQGTSLDALEPCMVNGEWIGRATWGSRSYLCEALRDVEAEKAWSWLAIPLVKGHVVMSPSGLVPVIGIQAASDPALVHSGHGVALLVQPQLCGESFLLDGEYFLAII